MELWHGQAGSSFDGSEIINAQRTEQYAANLRLPWFKPVYKNDSLGYMLGDDVAYRTPLLDNAPWMDNDADESADFLGLYPLDVVGIEASSRQASIIESTRNGGAVRGVRHGTKSIVFSAVLIALSEDGVEYGHRWLKQVLNGAPCVSGDCGGGALCYLSAEPNMEIPQPTDGYTIGYEEVSGYGDGLYGDGPYGGSNVVMVPPQQQSFFDPTPCLDPLMRSFRDVTVTSGPLVTSKMKLSDGSHAWAVTFTATASNPYEFGREVAVIEGFLDPAVDVPWAEGIVPGSYDALGTVYDEVPCYDAVPGPVYDPLCPALIPPPAPADVPLGCYTAPANWHRRQITIPKENIPLWGDVLPIIRVHARDAEVRALRLRFYTDVDETGDPNVDPCSFCGDIVLSYIPRGGTLVFDAASEAIYVETPNASRRADSLVFSTEGKPFDWPALTCGFGYIVTFDTTQTQAPPIIDLSLISRVI